MLDLRPYQSEALQRVYQAYKDGKRRVIVSLPTGTGKTVVFAHFPRFFKMKKRLLVLAHREELLLQARDKFLHVDPGLKVGIEQSVSRAPTEAKVVIASVPTLGRAGGTRLPQFSPEEFFLIVVDEAHHAVAPTYRRIFEHFGLFDRNTSRYLVGFTATPSPWRQAGSRRSVPGGMLRARTSRDDCRAISMSNHRLENLQRHIA